MPGSIKHSSIHTRYKNSITNRTEHTECQAVLQTQLSLTRYRLPFQIAHTEHTAQEASSFPSEPQPGCFEQHGKMGPPPRGGRWPASQTSQTTTQYSGISPATGTAAQLHTRPPAHPYWRHQAPASLLTVVYHQPETLFGRRQIVDSPPHTHNNPHTQRQLLPLLYPFRDLHNETDQSPVR